MCVQNVHARFILCYTVVNKTSYSIELRKYTLKRWDLLHQRECMF